MRTLNIAILIVAALTTDIILPTTTTTTAAVAAFVPQLSFTHFTTSTKYRPHRHCINLRMSGEQKQTGTVKWFNTMKGFGFIVPDDGSSDVFVHQTAIIAEGFRSLADGEKVEYRTQTDAQGRVKAIDVTGPNGGNVQGAPFRPTNDYNSF